MEPQGGMISEAALYTLVSIQFTAAILSAMIVVGLLIPLMIQLKRGSFQSAMVMQHSRRRLSRTQSEPPYSTYNLYLVYLALVDLVFLIPNIAAQLSKTKFYPQFYSYWHVPYNPNNGGVPPAIEVIINGPYSAANMWINAVIAYEVLILLQTSQRAQRITQPSLRRVNLHGGGVIFGSVLFAVATYYYFYYMGWEDSHPSSWPATISTNSIPFVYVVGVTFLVLWRGYIPSLQGSTPTDRAVRGLAFYFFRVSATFVAIWLPSGIFVMFVYVSPVGRENGIYDYLAHLFLAIQPIGTFCVILTKSDVKKYIKDLITLNYVFEDCKCCTKDKTAPMETNENTDESDPVTSTHSVTILGYTFRDVDTNDDDDVENADNIDIDADDHATQQ